MARAEAYPSGTLDVRERARKLLGNTAPARWAVRSSVSAYLRLDWFKIDADPESIAWARTVPGDPDAGRFRRNWNNAAILGVDQGALAKLQAHEPESGIWAKDAVAYEEDGVVRVGVNPESDRIFGGAGVEDQAGMLTVAMRLGRDPLRAAMGHFQPVTGELLVPHGVVVLEEFIPNQEIAKPDYPHTRLVR